MRYFISDSSSKFRYSGSTHQNLFMVFELNLYIGLSNPYASKQKEEISQSLIDFFKKVKKRDYSDFHQKYKEEEHLKIK